MSATEHRQCCFCLTHIGTFVYFVHTADSYEDEDGTLYCCPSCAKSA